MAEQQSTEVVPTVTQPMLPSLTHTQPMAAATVTEKSSRPPAAEGVVPPTTFELGKSVVDLHGGHEPVTWAGGSLELSEVAEHRPTSALDRDPTSKKWLTWAIGGSFGLVLILGFALTRGDEAEAGEKADNQAAVEIPQAPEPEPAPVVAPPPEPEPKKAKAKKSTTAKRDSTLAGTSEQAAASSTSKPAASKPAASTSKPAPAPSKPAVAPSKPTPTPTPSKPAGPNLAPPEEDASSSKAALPDVEGWDDQDQALGDRTAEE